MRAGKMKPGMLVDIDHKLGPDPSLILAVKGYDEIEYTHICPITAYHGAMVGFIDRKQKVHEITGARRDAIFKEILRELYQAIHNLKSNVDSVKLIKAMLKRSEKKE